MKRILTVIVMVAVVGFTSVASAGDQQLRPKSPGKATSLSLIGTLAPTFFYMAVSSSCSGPEGCSPAVAIIGLTGFVAGPIVGPGFGHMYARNKGRFWTGLGLRTAGLGGAVVAFALSYDNSDSDVALTGFVAGAGLWFGSAIYDIATAARSAREYNRKNGLGWLSVAPTFDLSKRQAGVRLSLQF